MAQADFPSTSVKAYCSSVPKKPGAIVRGIAVRQRAVADQFLGERAPLFLGVVVRAVGVGQETQPVGHRLQREAEGVGGPADVPAEGARRHPLEHHAFLPALAQDDVQPVQAPEGEQVGRAASADPDDVLGQQVRPDVRDVGHGEESEVRAHHAQFREGVMERTDVQRVLTTGGRDHADAGCRSGPGQFGGQLVGGSGTQVRGVVPVRLEPDAGGDDRRLVGAHVRRGGLLG